MEVWLHTFYTLALRSAKYLLLFGKRKRNLSNITAFLIVTACMAIERTSLSLLLSYSPEISCCRCGQHTLAFFSYSTANLVVSVASYLQPRCWTANLGGSKRFSPSPPPPPPPPPSPTIPGNGSHDQKFANVRAALIFRRVRNIAKSDDFSMSPSLRLEHLGSHWTDFREIWYRSFFERSVEKIKLSLIHDKNNGYFT